MSFDLICNRAVGGAARTRGSAGSGAPSALPSAIANNRGCEASKRGLDPPPHPARAVPTRRGHWSFREKRRVGGESQMPKLRPDSCERLLNSSVGHYVRSCTYYKSAREHARPVVSIRIFDSSEQCVVRRRRSSRVESLSVPSVSPVVSPGRFRPDIILKPPRRLTDEPPARAGANTMRGRARRRSPVPRPLPFRPTSMTPSALCGFGDETPSLSAVFQNQKKTKPGHSAPLASTTMAGVAILSGGC